MQAYVYRLALAEDRPYTADALLIIAGHCRGSH
jgi:hypothetical protein